MIIFVEGPAGAGKTSFIRALKEKRTDITVLDEYTMDEDGRSKKGLDTFIRNTDDKLRIIKTLPDDEVVVVDRGPISMLVNASVETQNGINDTLTQALQWYDDAAEQGSLIQPDLIVYISADSDLILERAKTGGWFRADLGWTFDPDLSKSTYEVFLAKYYANTPLIRLEGEKESVDLVDEFLDKANLE